MNCRTTAADMALMEKAFVHPSNDTEKMFDEIPLSFRIGDKKFCGIPDFFRRSSEREIVDSNITRYTYTGVCDECGLEIKATHLEYRDFAVSEWTAEFTNNGKEDTPVLSEIMLGGEISGCFREFVHGNGDTCGEDGYEWFRDELKDGGIQINPIDGTSCRGAFPYMKLVFDGFVCRAAVGWPHMWKAVVNRSENGVEYRCGQLRCNMKIHPGETMRTPRLTLMFTDGDEDRSRNIWRRWYMAHILPRENGRPIEPALCLHHWNCEGKPEHTAATEENQVSAIYDYINRGLKPDIWWIDAGWYKCDYDWPHTGTWKPDPDRFPNGFAPIGEACGKNGIRLLVWFEPERVVPGTELHEEHHDWLICERDESKGEHGNHLLNLGIKEACDWLIERVDSIIKEGHIRVYRQDFNFDPKMCWTLAEEEDRIGAIENLHVQGYLRYWDELIFRNPGLWIDSCASGGRRNDLETMRRAVPLHYTDVGYGWHAIKQKQFCEMHEWIPYFRSHNMSWDNESVAADGGEWVNNDEFSFQNAMVPAVTYMTWFNAPDEEFARSIAAEKIWRRAAKLTLDGDYYPLTECRKDTSDWYVCQFDDSDRGEGFVQFIRNNFSPDSEFTAHPHTENGREYLFENSSTGETFRMTSDELNSGLRITLPKRSGVVLFYKIV
ncbi:MAG: alpha-galactosidase [Eubacteriales bacterium]